MSSGGTVVELTPSTPWARLMQAARADAHVLVVWAAMTAWSVVMFATVRDDYRGYRLGRFDLGNMTQAVWSTAHGSFLDSTDITGQQATRLASHVDPILTLLVPLWLLAPSPLTLATAQVVAVALGALPVFWLGRRHLSSPRLAVLLAGAYLLYPWLSWTTLDAVHPVTFAIPLLLYAVWFLDIDRLGPFVVCAVLAASCGELLGLTIGALGAWYALARRRRVAGFVIAAGGVAWTFVALLVVVPAFSGGASDFYGFYKTVGGSPAGIVKSAFTDPLAILGQLFDPDVLLFLIALAAPLAGLFLLAPALAAVALPQLALNALADPAGPIDPRQHYLAAMLPFLVAATVSGIARLRLEARGSCSRDGSRALPRHITRLRAARWRSRDGATLVPDRADAGTRRSARSGRRDGARRSGSERIEQSRRTSRSAPLPPDVAARRERRLDCSRHDRPVASRRPAPGARRTVACGARPTQKALRVRPPVAASLRRRWRARVSAGVIRSAGRRP